jgi:hypothetical protein
MVCNPMHVHRKRREINPSFFGHAFTYGLSVQRLDEATTEELVDWIGGFVEKDQNRTWLGYVQCTTEAVRKVVDDGERQFCVYDAALDSNQAHAEIGISKHIEETEQLELRAMLMKVFDAGNLRQRQVLKDGQIWAGLSQAVRDRPLPSQWA